MIDGITVINQYYIPNGAYTFGIFLLLLLFMCGIGLIAFGIFSFTSNMYLFGTLSILLGILTVIGSITCFIDANETKNNHLCKYYEVTIDNSVSFNDVMENYEIIDQNGQIWTIELKEK